MNNQHTNTRHTTYDSRLELINTVNTIVSVAENWIKEHTDIGLRLQVVGEILPRENDAIAMAQMIANILGMAASDYTIRSRVSKYVHLRHLACYFIREYYPELPLKHIQRIVGHGDYSAVSSSIAATIKLKETNTIFKTKYEQTLQAVTQWIRK